MGRSPRFQSSRQNSRPDSPSARQNLADFQSLPREFRRADGTPRHHSRTLSGSRQVGRARNPRRAFAQRTGPSVARVLQFSGRQTTQEISRSPGERQSARATEIFQEARSKGALSKATPQK